MPKFSEQSARMLEECDPRLQMVMRSAIEGGIDFSVVCGARTVAEQAEKVRQGLSKTMRSKHVIGPAHPLSRAVDLAPYPIDWGDKGDAKHRAKAIARFYLLAGWILATAKQMQVRLRWGGDWDQDWDLFDNKFEDLGHFELVED